MRIVRPSQDGIGHRFRQAFQACQSGKDNPALVVTSVNGHLIAYRQELDGSISQEQVDTWAQ